MVRSSNEMRRGKFQCDDAVELDVLRAIHRPHAARADLSQYPVVADDGPGEIVTAGRVSFVGIIHRLRKTRFVGLARLEIHDLAPQLDYEPYSLSSKPEHCEGPRIGLRSKDLLRPLRSPGGHGHESTWLGRMIPRCR